MGAGVGVEHLTPCIAGEYIVAGTVDNATIFKQRIHLAAIGLRLISCVNQVVAISSGG
jgi:hypothetical protein